MHDVDRPSGFRGPLLRPGDAEYDPARKRLFNVALDGRPRLIARPLDSEDVACLLRHAHSRGIPLAVRGGGHDLDGRAMVDDALAIDFTLMRDVRVRAHEQSARAEAGVLLGELDRSTQRHGLATVAGTVSNTGIAGLTLGGGIGWLMRRYGTTVDNVIAFEAVTVEGERIRVSEDSNPDLFWALRGGGGNFAVVTAFDYRLHRVGPAVTGGRLVYTADAADEALAIWRDLMLDAPRELASTVVIGALPPFPFIPERHHRQPGVTIAVCHCGTPEAAERHLRPLTSLGGTLANTVGPMSYLGLQSMSDAMGNHGAYAYELGGYLPPEIDDEVGRRLLSRAGTGPTHRAPIDANVVMLTRMGGAVDDTPESAAAFPREGAGWYWNAVVQWEQPEQGEPMRAWAQDVHDQLAPWTLERCYINLSVDRGPEWLKRAYGEAAFRRLRALKAQWDPDNLLRHNKNIPPADEALVRPRLLADQTAR